MEDHTTGILGSIAEEHKRGIDPAIPKSDKQRLLKNSKLEAKIGLLRIKEPQYLNKRRRGK